MAHNQNASTKIPDDLIARRQEGWHAFTRITMQSCVVIVGVLLLMLVFLRIL